MLRVIQGGLAAASFVLLVVPAIAQDFYSQCIRNPNEQRNAYVLQTNLGGAEAELESAAKGGANRAQQAVMVWREIPVPVIAAVHGVAWGFPRPMPNVRVVSVCAILGRQTSAGS